MARRLLLALPAGVLLVACGGFLSGFTECGLRPVGEAGAGVRIGPAVVAATSCVPRVEVDGRIYDVGVGRWLDEATLDVTEYGPITALNEPVLEPIAYALEGVDPQAILLIRSDRTDDLGPMGPFMILYGPRSDPLPEALCRFADASDPQYPTECRIAAED
jgi:hypothetical protein